MRAFYHSADLDGFASGAIIKHFKPECELIGYNYGEKFPWESIKPGETVYMADISLPIDKMVELAALVKLVWIDHHSGIIREFDALPDGVKTMFLGRLSIKKAACELCWEYFSTERVPHGIEMLGVYDSWRFTPDTEYAVKAFQYGMRSFKETHPEKAQRLWERLIRGEVMDIQTIGKTIYDYQLSQNERACNNGVFETKLITPDGYSLDCIALNSHQVGSDMFRSVWDEHKYEAMMVFYWSNNGEWNVSLYSTRAEVDCSVWAKKMDGGGHKGASGFRCKELPFELGGK